MKLKHEHRLFRVHSMPSHCGMTWISKHVDVDKNKMSDNLCSFYRVIFFRGDFDHGKWTGRPGRTQTRRFSGKMPRWIGHFFISWRHRRQTQTFGYIRIGIRNRKRALGSHGPSVMAGFGQPGQEATCGRPVHHCCGQEQRHLSQKQIIRSWLTH